MYVFYEVQFQTEEQENCTGTPLATFLQLLALLLKEKKTEEGPS